MHKYIVLRFRNAKLFRNKKTKDKVFDDNVNKRDRSGIPWFTEPITVHQVSNMLHVIFGERPVPTVREAGLHYGKNKDIFEMAKNSHLRLDVFYYEKKDGESVMAEETVRVKKAVPDAWEPNPAPLYWERVRKIMADNFDGFYDALCGVLGPDQIDRPFRDVWRDLQGIVQRKLVGKKFDKPREILMYLRGVDETKLVALIDYLSSVGRTGFADGIMVPLLTKQLNSVKGAAITVVKGKDTASFINGSIYVPVDDAWIERVKQQTGNASILDGGFVWIDSIRSGNELSLDGFRKMDEVSLETY